MERHTRLLNTACSASLVRLRWRSREIWDNRRRHLPGPRPYGNEQSPTRVRCQKAGSADRRVGGAPHSDWPSAGTRRDRADGRAAGLGRIGRDHRAGVQHLWWSGFLGDVTYSAESVRPRGLARRARRQRHPCPEVSFREHTELEGCQEPVQRPDGKLLEHRLCDSNSAASSPD